MTALPVADRAEVRRYARVLVRRHPRMLAGALALHVGAAVAGLAAPRLLGGLVETLTTSTAAIAAVDRTALAIAGFLVLQAVLARYAHVASARLGERVLAALREEFIGRVLSIPLSTVEKAGTGDLLTRTSHDVAVLSKSVRFAVPETLIAISTATFIFGALLLVAPVLAVPCLIVVPLLWAGTRWYLRRAPDGYLAESAAYSRITDGLSETVDGARTVEALRRQEHRRRRTDTDIARQYAAERYTLWLRTVWFPLIEISYVVPVAATLAIGGWCYLRGWVTLGQVTAAVLYVQMLAAPLDRLLNWLDELQLGAASLARLLGVAQPGRPATAVPRAPAPDGACAADPVAAVDVHFSYVDGREVLRGVTLVPRPGERIAIVGPSGAGKSTLGRLLAGVLRPTAGSVTAGGVPLTDLAPDQLRGRVALVTQEHHVFIGTVRDNVALVRPDASDAEVREALAAVDALDWVSALPDGVATVVGAGGHPVGPDQAQQLALARLVLADPQTLVLDEATSLIDPRTARRTERSLAVVLHGRTVIAIAHRLYSAHDADRIAVVEDGLITEFGSHDELVAADGPYAELWRTWQGLGSARAVG
ncbi:ABC transporter ATP-binding protein [Solwaraspora sp. WMMD937]|uniref:ABC transporter ATP-binding protein n=1 Tax=Solwaraspora sp. WMMD937 TaxID=3016090 RepID=UPI002499F0CD|nr:ABC transporter ATP-binding protein [Solwaraspora sp. WMMD937]WFE23416.1 ABC transporter ATP-binding protein [Solwaraspora sp. WMMD937]